MWVQHCEEVYLALAARWGLLPQPALHMDLPDILQAHLEDPQVAPQRAQGLESRIAGPGSRIGLKPRPEQHQGAFPGLAHAPACAGRQLVSLLLSFEAAHWAARHAVGAPS